MQAAHPRPSRTDSSNSSTPAPVADSRITDLFASFAAIWPRKWRVTEQSARVWSFAVARLDDQAIAAGLRQLIDDGEQWPLEPGAFAILCRESQRRQRHELEAALQPPTPAEPSPREAAWSAVAGTFALRLCGRSTARSAYTGPFDVNAFLEGACVPAGSLEPSVVAKLFEQLRVAFDRAWHRAAP